MADEIAAMRPRLYRFACTLTSDREEAADLAQEALERGIRARDAFTPGTNLKAWLFAILHNAYANHRRSAGRFQGWVGIEDPDAERDLDQPIDPVEHEVLRRAQMHEVLRALDALPRTYALPLRLVAIDELTYAEVADVLGVPAGTVMSRIYRAKVAAAADGGGIAMSDPCTSHRSYLAAIADREVELVPAESLEHVQECPDCRRELSTHQLLGERLQQAREEEVRGRVASGRRKGWLDTRLRRVAAVAALLLAVAGGGLGAAHLVERANDPTATSASWASAGPQLRSTDYGQIRLWCERGSGHALPYTTPASLQPVGARMDRWGDQDLPTVFFETASGEDVMVTWIATAGTSPQQGSVETRQDGGQSLLVVRGPTGTMVVRGNASGAALWSVAADLAAASP